MIIDGASLSQRAKFHLTCSDLYWILVEIQDLERQVENDNIIIDRRENKIELQAEQITRLERSRVDLRKALADKNES